MWCRAASYMVSGRAWTGTVAAAYEKHSIALSSNLHPAGFDELMPKTIANANRLIHDARSCSPLEVGAAVAIIQ